MIRIALIITVLSSSIAAAQETAEAESPQWSIGAGIGTGVYSYGSAFYLDPVTSILTKPQRSAFFVERGVSRATSLILDVAGDYDRSSGLGGTPEATLRWAALSMGLRHVFNRGALVELSIWTTAVGGWGVIDGWNAPVFGQAPSSSSVRGYSAGLALGLAAERRLLDALYLRISTMLARVDYVWTQQRTEGEAGRLKESDLHGSVGIAPALELRLAF